MQRRSLLLLATLPFMLPCAELAAQAAFPSRPIEVVIPLPPGGPTDTAPRILLEHLRPLLKATMVPVNKVGAGGAIGSDYVHRSAPDGHTILATSNPRLSVKTAIDKKTPYKIEDFAAIGMYATDVGILAARRELGIKTIDDLIARAKKNPDELSYASAGQGSVSHVSAELFKAAAGVKILHVPHRGSGPAVQAVLGGHVPLISGAFSAIAPLIESGDVVPLITTAPQRLPGLPDVPTLAEKGYADATLNIWMGFFVPAQTPQPVVQALSAALAQVATDPAVTGIIARARMTPDYGDGTRTRQLLEKEYAIVTELAQKVQLGE